LTNRHRTADTADTAWAAYEQAALAVFSRPLPNSSP